MEPQNDLLELQNLINQNFTTKEKFGLKWHKCTFWLNLPHIIYLEKVTIMNSDNLIFFLFAKQQKRFKQSGFGRTRDSISQYLLLELS